MCLILTIGLCACVSRKTLVNAVVCIDDDDDKRSKLCNVRMGWMREMETTRKTLYTRNDDEMKNKTKKKNKTEKTEEIIKQNGR